MATHNNRSLVQANFFNTSNDGTKFQHNFENRHLDEEQLAKPTRAVGDAISDVTKKELDKIVGLKTAVGHQKLHHNLAPGAATYIKFTPKNQSEGTNSGASQRIIKMHETQIDPLAPSQFKHKRIPKGPDSPPVTIVHSPKRKLTMKDQQDWKIPPCISNWKNAKGYTIPLDMRLSADGRTLQKHTVNEKFAKLADSFYIAERKSRQEIEERTRIQKTMAYKEFLKKEEHMRVAAQQAREERTRILDTAEPEETLLGKRKHEPEDEAARKERDMLRYITRREVERETRMDAARSKKSKSARDAERDISEKVALGQAQPTSTEAMYDQRLFNQSSGIDTGFADEDDYTAYDKPLFADRTAQSIYNVRESAMEEGEDKEGGEAAAAAPTKKTELEKVLSRQPHRGFEGAERKGARTKPVEFEKQNDDMFGLDSFVSGGEPTKKLKTK
jgi:SNW domain-containing protein 1